MKILVVGAGALGGYIGGLFARAGEEVTFLARGAALAALQTNGLTIRSKEGGDFSLPVTAMDQVPSTKSFDCVLLSVKAYDLEQTAQAVAALVGTDTTVLAVQNGIEHPERLGRVFGSQAVLPMVVYISSTVRGPGIIEQMGDTGWVQIGELNGQRSERLKRIAGLLTRAGLTVETYDDIWVPLWVKFADICAFSGVTAMTRITFPEIIAIPELRSFYRDVLVEVVRVGQASGVQLDDDLADRSVAEFEALEALPERGSMAYDLLAGRRLELDTLNGSAMRLGQRYGVDTPLNRAIVAALLPYKDGTPTQPA